MTCPLAVAEPAAAACRLPAVVVEGSGACDAQAASVKAPARISKPVTHLMPHLLSRSARSPRIVAHTRFADEVPSGPEGVRAGKPPAKHPFPQRPLPSLLTFHYRA